MKKFLFFLLTVLMFMPLAMRAQSSCTPPTNLVANVHEPLWRNVQLSWTAPVDSTEAIVKWSTTYATKIGLGEDTPVDMVGAVRFEPSDLVGMNGRVLTAVSFVPGESQSVCTYSIQVWQGGSIAGTQFNPGTLLLDQVVTVPLIIDQVNTVLLDSIINIDPTQELWIGIHCNAQYGYPLGASQNTMAANKGELMFLQNQWMTLTDGGLTGYNWLIEGVLKESDNIISGYNLYRDDVVQNATPLISTAYIDSLENGTYHYAVTALYANSCESDPITATVTMVDNPCENCADSLIVGTGTEGTMYLPTNAYYGYTYSQQIYTAAEVGNITGQIPCLAFQYIYNSPISRNLKVYMGNTTKSSFSSTLDWVPMSDLMLVYDGEMNFDNTYAIDNWVNIPLSIPFEWDGTSNIVIAFVDETGSYYSNASYFNVHSASSMSLYAYRDASPYNPVSPESGTVGSIRNNIKFRVGEPITCFMPTHYAVSEITSSGVTASWMSHGTESGFELVLVPSTSTFDDEAPFSVTDTFYQFMNLIENTEYTLYLRANCGADDYSSWQMRSFKTPCNPATMLPYEENFENCGAGTQAYPDCWSKISNDDAFPYVNMAPDSSQALYFYTTSSKYNVAVSQAVDFTMASTDMALTFKALKTSSSYGRLDVGFMTNPTDLNTFVLLKSIYPSDYTGTSDWTSFVVPLTGTYSQPVYMAFYAPEGATSYFYVDDIKVGEMTGCSNPSNLTVSNVAGMSAILNWTAAPFGVTEYVVEYSEAGTDNWQINTVSGTQSILTNLVPETPYDVRVYSSCYDATSLDTLTVSFNTICAAFSSVVGDVTIGNGTSTSSYFPSYSFYNYSYTQQLFLASEMSGAKRINTMFIDYAASESKTRTYDIYLMHTTQTSISNWISITNAVKVYTGTIEWQTGLNELEFNVPFEYNGTDNLLVIFDDNTGSYLSGASFRGHTTTNNMSHYVYSDATNYDPQNITVSGTASTFRNNIIFRTKQCDSSATCFAPNPYVTNVSDTSVIIDWIPGATENAWDVEYMMENDTTWTPVGTAYASPFTVEGLIPDVNYILRMRSVCSASENSAWATLNFYTPCMVASLPLIEDFDSYTASSSTTIPCWTKGTNLSTNYPYPTTSYSHSGANSLYFSASASGYSYLATPKFSDEIAMDSLQIQFYAYKTSSSDYIEVGVMSDPDDISSFVPVGQYNSNGYSHWEMVEINTTHYQGTGRYVAFRIPQWISSYVYVDDININYVPHCAHVNNIVATNVTNESASLTWTAGDAETTWGYLYGLANTVDLSNDYPITISSNQLDLFSLTSNSWYDVYIYASCDDGYFSNPVKFTFKTNCDPMDSLPYVQNFDQLVGSTSGSVNNLPDCWNYINNGTSSSYKGYPIVYNSSSVVQSQPNALRFYTYETTDNTMSDQYAILPAFNEQMYPLNNLMLDFDARKYSTSYSAFTLIVGVLTNVSDAASFVPVDTLLITSDSYSAYTVLFNNYVGTGNIALMAPQITNDYYNSGYIDNLMVSEIPSCIRPQSIAVASSDMNSVTLQWDVAGTETAWNIAYGAQGFNPETGGTILNAATNPFAVTNLSPDTLYDFYVQADCGNGDASAWRGVVSARPGSYTMGTNGSESLSLCGFHIYDDGGVAGNYSSSVDYTLTLLPDVQGNCVTITGTADLENNYDKLYIYDGSDAFGTLLETITGQGVTVNVTSSGGPLTLNFHTDGSVVHGGFDLEVSCGTCQPPPTPPTPPDPCYAPTNLTATNVTTNSVLLSWTENGTANSWTINYKEDGVNTWSTATSTSTTYTLTGLVPDKAYSAYVVAICPEETSDPSNTITFTTLPDGSGIDDYAWGIALYPNPTSGELKIENAEWSIDQVMVYDVYGKLLMNVEVNSNVATIDASSFANGMYFVRIATEKGIVTKSFVKK